MIIPRQQEVITKLGKKQQSRIEAILHQIKEIIDAAETLPILITQSVFGDCSVVVFDSVKKAIEQAGWRITFVCEDLGVKDFTIQ